ncbi:hypothetical protein Q1695_010053 [Nippostrongylus brasiliensis]|nr:hypothetical protein Q1695_010053 [Nippostrongylus brasiliensis]
MARGAQDNRVCLRPELKDAFQRSSLRRWYNIQRLEEKYCRPPEEEIRSSVQFDLLTGDVFAPVGMKSPQAMARIKKLESFEKQFSLSKMCAVYNGPEVFGKQYARRMKECQKLDTDFQTKLKTTYPSNVAVDPRWQPYQPNGGRKVKRTIVRETVKEFTIEASMEQLNYLMKLKNIPSTAFTKQKDPNFVNTICLKTSEVGDDESTLGHLAITDGQLGDGAPLPFVATGNCSQSRDVSPATGNERIANEIGQSLPGNENSPPPEAEDIVSTLIASSGSGKERKTAGQPELKSNSMLADASPARASQRTENSKFTPQGYKKADQSSSAKRGRSAQKPRTLATPVTSKSSGVPATKTPVSSKAAPAMESSSLEKSASKATLSGPKTPLAVSAPTTSRKRSKSEAKTPTFSETPKTALAEGRSTSTKRSTRRAKPSAARTPIAGTGTSTSRERSKSEAKTSATPAAPKTDGTKISGRKPSSKALASASRKRSGTPSALKVAAEEGPSTSKKKTAPRRKVSVTKTPTSGTWKRSKSEAETPSTPKAVPKEEASTSRKKSATKTKAPVKKTPPSGVETPEASRKRSASEARTAVTPKAGSSTSNRKKNSTTASETKERQTSTKKTPKSAAETPKTALGSTGRMRTSGESKMQIVEKDMGKKYSPPVSSDHQSPEARCWSRLANASPVSEGSRKRRICERESNRDDRCPAQVPYGLWDEEGQAVMKSYEDGCSEPKRMRTILGFDAEEFRNECNGTQTTLSCFVKCARKYRVSSGEQCKVDAGMKEDRRAMAAAKSRNRKLKSGYFA